MSQSLAHNLVHLVYSTKDRRPVLTDEVREKLFAYQAGIYKGHECPAIIIGGVPDHLHTLFLLSKNVALKTIVEEVKKGSSKWIKTQGKAFEHFYWQGGYGAFSVSQSNVERVRKYIQNQAEHHRAKSFQDEFRELLMRHEIEFDERYVRD